VGGLAEAGKDGGMPCLLHGAMMHHTCCMAKSAFYVEMQGSHNMCRMRRSAKHEMNNGKRRRSGDADNGNKENEVHHSSTLSTL
jgi:hypothetical protein